MFPSDRRTLNEIIAVFGGGAILAYLTVDLFFGLLTAFMGVVVAVLFFLYSERKYGD